MGGLVNDASGEQDLLLFPDVWEGDLLQATMLSKASRLLRVKSSMLPQTAGSQEEVAPVPVSASMQRRSLVLSLGCNSDP